MNTKKVMGILTSGIFPSGFIDVILEGTDLFLIIPYCITYGSHFQKINQYFALVEEIHGF